jgi:hypothetical protein
LKQQVQAQRWVNLMAKWLKREKKMPYYLPDRVERQVPKNTLPLYATN